MMMKNLITATLMTITTSVLLGVVYPLAVTGLAQVIFPSQANGGLIERDNRIIGSRLIGQAFTGAAYFNSRPSAAGASGYDAAASSGSNYAPTSRKLIERVTADAERARSENGGAPVPVDLVTTSASGLDPHISIAAAEYQVARVAATRGAREDDLRRLVRRFTEGRTFGVLGEPRVNVLELNLELDKRFPRVAEDLVTPTP